MIKFLQKSVVGFFLGSFRFFQVDNALDIQIPFLGGVWMFRDKYHQLAESSEVEHVSDSKKLVFWTTSFFFAAPSSHLLFRKKKLSTLQPHQV